MKLDLTTSHKVQDLQEALKPLFARAREVGIEDVPDEATVDEWTAALFTDRGGKLRRRKQAGKDANDDIRSLFGVMEWHHSGGNLMGLMIAQVRTNKFDEIATYAQLMLVAFGHESSALDAWKRTGLF